MRQILGRIGLAALTLAMIASTRALAQDSESGTSGGAATAPPAGRRSYVGGDLGAG